MSNQSNSITPLPLVTAENVDLGRKFVFHERVESALKKSFAFKRNIVLYGVGGTGKSQMSEEFFRQIGVNPFVKALSQGTKIADLYGGMNMPLFHETGKTEYLLDNSMFNHEYVILEEAFDAPPQVLESLKDALQSKIVRNGTQQFPIKTKMIVVCTNRSKSDIAVDNSLKALMERFLYSVEVKWDMYTSKEYSCMFDKVFGDPHTFFAEIVEKANEISWVSPRTAVQSLPIFKKFGIEGLRDIEGFSDDVLKSLTAKEDEIKRKEAVMAKIKRFLDQWTLIQCIEKPEDCEECIGLIYEVCGFKNTIDNIEIEESFFEELKKMKEECKNHINFLTRELIKQGKEKTTFLDETVQEDEEA